MNQIKIIKIDELETNEFIENFHNKIAKDIAFKNEMDLMLFIKANIVIHENHDGRKIYYVKRDCPLEPEESEEQ